MVRTLRASRVCPIVLSLVVSACSGSIEGGAGGPQSGIPADPAPSDPGAPAAPASPGDPAPPPASTPAAPGAPPAPFTTVRETLRLLPFDTRLNRLAVAMGLPPTDKLFDGLRARRLDLGDQDYGKGVTPDPSWSPNRMALWVKLMRPICQSPQMTTKFPSLRTDATPLIAAAWGRPAAPADLDAIRAGLTGVADDRKGELTCLAILSAVEFVAR